MYEGPKRQHNYYIRNDCLSIRNVSCKISTWKIIWFDIPPSNRFYFAYPVLIWNWMCGVEMLWKYYIQVSFFPLNNVVRYAKRIPGYNCEFYFQLCSNKSLTFPMNTHSPGLLLILNRCVRAKLVDLIHLTDSNMNSMVKWSRPCSN